MSDQSKIDICQLSPMKCGTTWLTSIVGRHPDMHVFNLRSVHPDDLPDDLDQAAREESLGASDKTALYARFPVGQRAIHRETSTGHGQPPERVTTRNSNPGHRLAARLLAHNPQMKFVVVLRNPIDRLLSHWRHDVVKMSAMRQRNNPAVSVKKSAFKLYFDINEYIQARDFDFVQGPGFLRKSLYHWCLVEYLELFGPDRFLVLTTESLFETPVDHLQSIFEFCGVSGMDEALLTAAASSPRNTAGDMERVLSSWLPRRSKVLVPLTPESRAILRELFSAETQQLNVALGRAIGNDWFSS